MNLIGTFIVWTWLLGIALVVPTTLPAGGAQKSNIQYRKNNISSPIIALKEFKKKNPSDLTTPFLEDIENRLFFFSPHF